MDWHGGGRQEQRGEPGRVFDRGRRTSPRRRVHGRARHLGRGRTLLSSRRRGGGAEERAPRARLRPRPERRESERSPGGDRGEPPRRWRPGRLLHRPRGARPRDDKLPLGGRLHPHERPPRVRHRHCVGAGDAREARDAPARRRGPGRRRSRLDLRQLPERLHALHPLREPRLRGEAPDLSGRLRLRIAPPRHSCVAQTLSNPKSETFSVPRQKKPIPGWPPDKVSSVAVTSSRSFR